MKEHDKLAKRLGIILTRLNTGEKLYLEELSREFNVSERTLQRDFNERLNYLPIERIGACYFLDPKVLGNQSGRELSILLLNMGLDNLFPSKHYLSNGVLNNSTMPPFLFKNPRIEDISQNASVFEKLIESVQRNNVISFTYEGLRYNEFLPYRLVNDRSIWYLAGTHRKRLHSFRIAKISELVRYDNKYSPDINISQKLSGVALDEWRNDAVEVILQIQANAIDSLFKEDTTDRFSILKELDSGDVLASYQTNNIPALFSQLKTWLPDVEVLSPDWVRYQLKQELQAYLDSTK
ncbi:YafY family protein [Photobacterium sp. OFAV2-7]|uniref:helix-turn-helix transcriptional regulator n=1 Tax=Photobacterium sp. OFAV2-7 TaxID=2917748 RepID=UPI001EF5DDC0|nr:WYL domain-containing protein [Photobacterium sp. OFAV2-7]